MSFFRVLAVTVLLLASGAFLAAENKYDNFYNIDFGLDAYQARCFVQDVKGFIWIGTDKGLCRYDGYNVHNHYNSGYSNSVQIHSMAFCGDDTLFLGTEQGLKSYDIRSGVYTEDYAGPNCTIRCMLVYGDTLWVGTVHGLYMYDISDRRWIVLLDDLDIYSIVKIRDRVYAGSVGTLHYFRTDSMVCEKVSVQGFPYFYGAVLADEKEDVLWLGGRELYKYHIYTDKLTRVCEIGFIPKNLLRDSDGNFVIGTDYGLCVTDIMSGKSELHSHNSFSRNSLSNNVVQGVFEDSYGNVWIGTDYGISLARKHEPYVYTSVAEFSSNGKGNQFFALQRDSGGNLWMGGNNGILKNTFRGKDVDWYEMTNRDDRLRIRHNRIRDIYEDTDGRLWVCSDGGLLGYDEKTKSFKSYMFVDSKDNVGMNWLYDMEEDREGNFWISTYNRGVFRIDPDDLIPGVYNSYDFLLGAEDGLESDFVNSIVYNKTSHSIYALMNRWGLYRIDCASSLITPVDILDHTEGEFPLEMISDEDECIWVSFSKGIVRMNAITGETETVYFANGRRLSVICMESVGNDVWVCTNEGIWIISKDMDLVSNFSIEDRIFFSMHYSPEYGEVYLGGVDAYATVSANVLEQTGKSGGLAISRILVNGREYVSPKGEVSRYVENLTLKFDQNDIIIELADLTYSNAGINHILWSSDEEEGTLLKSGTNRITFPAMSPGTHLITYENMAMTMDPDVNNSMLIKIRRHPLTSVAAYFIYVLVFIALLWAMVSRLVMKNRLEIERIDREKTMEQAEEKMRFFSNLSHEFKTPLSMIIAPVSKMLSEKRSEKDIKDLSMIQEYALKMNQMIQKSIEYGRDGNMPEDTLIRSNVEIVSFIQTIFSMFEDNHINFGKEFVFTSTLETLNCMLDVVKFESIINNLLSNACKYTNKGDSIIVSVSRSADMSSVEIKVSDTGVGIPENELPYIFHRFFQSPTNSMGKEGTGIGLCLVKGYVTLHGGEISVKSTLGEGTGFTICLPLVKIENADEGSSEADGRADNYDNREGLPTIVIVEDNEAVAKFLMDLFHDDYRCVLALNGKTGLGLCNEILPDLVITDIMMPVMDGMNMCKKLRANAATASIPIVVLTAVADKRYEMFSANQRVDAFITKPFDSKYIYMRVKNLIDKKLEMEKHVRIEMMTRPKEINAISPDEKLLARMVDIIEEHISDSDFNVNSLCELLDISNKQIYRKCTQLLNMTPVEYIRTVRLKKAALLLEQHNFNISEVMYMVGFNNHSYFSKCFQKEFGVTPVQYRNEH